MKTFLIACAAAVVMAVGAWLVLEHFQQPVSVAYTTTGARI